jgi:predicted regulator of Ras-like GTPase activity (Roadblock/LC7/MglB family)
MSRFRLILLSLLVALVVGVVASASASEPPDKCGGTVTTAPNYCVEGLQLENAKGESTSAKVEGTDGVSVLKATVGGVPTEIECKGGKSTGSIKNGASGGVGKSTTNNKFEECKLLTPTNCKLPTNYENEIQTAELPGALGLTSGRIETKFTEGGFADIEIEGKESSCVIAGVGKPKVFEISGTQRCEIDSANSEAETEALTHKVICNTSGGGLKLGGNKAEMTSEATVKLTSGKKWSVKESA